MTYGIMLICSLLTTPDVRNCDTTNAVRVVRGAEGSPLPLGCARNVLIKAAADGVQIGPSQYPVIRCGRSEFGGRQG